MDNDDLPVGRILTRREVLALFGLAGTAALAACAPASTPTAAPATQAPATTVASTQAPAMGDEAATSVALAAEPTLATTPTPEVVAGGALPACVVAPAMAQGPFFVDDKLNRSDIRTNTADGKVSAGAELLLTLRVLQAGSNGCTPIQGALVDVWHCDAQGFYSGVADPRASTAGQDFLRGQQLTDANGQAAFTTIYPGWYPGRAIHVHFKVRGSTAGQNYEFTSQLFFDDAFSDQVFTQPAYAKPGRHTLNTEDGIFMRSGGEVMKLNVTEAGGKYTATFDIGMQI